MKKLIVLILSIFTVAGLLPFTAVNSFAAATKAGNEAVLVSAVEKGGDIQISKNIALTNTVVIADGKKVTLDLNGYTLDRGQSFVSGNGSVIKVEAGAELVIKDSGHKNYGKIRGGFAYNGGGIANYGTLTLESGTITANKALDNTYGNGGGIYNADGATLILKGGVIEDNRARNGGGIYNATGGKVSVEQGSYQVTELSQLKTYYTNVSITNNKASADGSGIYNASVFNLKDSPKLTGNLNDCDLYVAYGKVVTFNGKFNPSGKIGVDAAAKGVAFTKDYTKYITKTPAEIFKTLDTDYTVKQTEKNGEAMLYSSAKTRVEEYNVGSDNKISASNLAATYEYDTPQEAWNKVTGIAAKGKRIVMTLGSDWEHDTQLTVGNNGYVDVDLNGRYIKRTRNHDQTDNGSVFKITNKATLFIHDSNPKRKGYDGIKGGVITGGASEDSGGGIVVEGDCRLLMDGGTIYECVTSNHGGGIYCANSGRVELNNCRIYFCQTFDSVDRCHGGGIYARYPTTLSLHNCIIQDCYAEDYGGGIYFEGDGNYNNILMLGSNMFIGNNCYDYGGAIYMSVGKGAYIDKCTFSTNSSYDDGGAVYIKKYGESSTDPIMIRDSKFTENSCKDGGAAIFAECNDIVLLNDEITHNHSGIGAVWLGAKALSYGYDISVSGLMIVRDNTAENTNHHGIVLDDMGATHNYIYSAGLYEGSHIDFSVNDDGKMEAVKNVSTYQMQYFHATTGTMSFETKKTIENTLVTASSTASLFGKGSIITVCAICGAAAVGLIAAYAYKKKKGAADDESEE